MHFIFTDDEKPFWGAATAEEGYDLYNYVQVKLEVKYTNAAGNVLTILYDPLPEAPQT